MADKQIKEFTLQDTPQTGDWLLMQQAADDAVRKITIQDVADFASFASTRQIVVGAGNDAVVNGTALKAAYAEAKTRSPVATDWVTIKLTSGSYDFGSTGLTMDTDYIAIVGEGSPPWDESGFIVTQAPVSMVVCDTDRTLKVTCRYTLLANMHVRQESNAVGALDANNASYADFLVCRNVAFTGPTGSRIAVESSSTGRCNGTFIDCYFRGAAFYNCDFGGFAFRCRVLGALGGFGSLKTFDGYAKECTVVGVGGFGGSRHGVMAGLCEDCVNEGDQGFGGSISTSTGGFTGVARRCRNTGDYGFGGNKYAPSAGAIAAGAVVEDCINEGNYGFAGGALAGYANDLAGTCRRCRNEGDSGFAGSGSGSTTSKITGVVEDCENEGDGGFGCGGVSTGTLRRCRNVGRTTAIPGWNGLMIDCEFKVTSANIDAVLLVGDAAKLYKNILIANGTGKSVNAAGAQNVVSAGNLMNLGLGANVTNLVALSTDLTDSNIDL